MSKNKQDGEFVSYQCIPKRVTDKLKAVKKTNKKTLVKNKANHGQVCFSDASNAKKEIQGSSQAHKTKKEKTSKKKHEGRKKNERRSKEKSNRIRRQVTSKGDKGKLSVKKKGEVKKRAKLTPAPQNNDQNNEKRSSVLEAINNISHIWYPSRRRVMKKNLSLHDSVLAVSNAFVFGDSIMSRTKNVDIIQKHTKGDDKNNDKNDKPNGQQNEHAADDVITRQNENNVPNITISPPTPERRPSQTNAPNINITPPTPEKDREIDSSDSATPTPPPPKNPILNTLKERLENAHRRFSERKISYTEMQNDIQSAYQDFTNKDDQDTRPNPINFEESDDETKSKSESDSDKDEEDNVFSPPAEKRMRLQPNLSYDDSFVDDLPYTNEESNVLNKGEKEKEKNRDSGRETMFTGQVTSTPEKILTRKTLPDLEANLANTPADNNEFLLVSNSDANKISEFLDDEESEDKTIETPEKREDDKYYYFPVTSAHKEDYKKPFDESEVKEIPKPLQEFARALDQEENIYKLQNILITLHGTKAKDLDYATFNMPETSTMYKPVLKHYLIDHITTLLRYQIIRQNRLDLIDKKTYQPILDTKILKREVPKTIDTEDFITKANKSLNESLNISKQQNPDKSEVFEDETEADEDKSRSTASDTDDEENKSMLERNLSLKDMFQETKQEFENATKNKQKVMLDEKRDDILKRFDDIFKKGQLLAKEKNPKVKRDLISQFMPVGLKTVVQGNRALAFRFIDILQTATNRVDYSRKMLKFFDYLNDKNYGKFITWKNLAIPILMLPDQNDPREQASYVQQVGNDSSEETFKTFYKL